jgi:O-succinylbenzoic acid--CoA ligase
MVIDLNYNNTQLKSLISGKISQNIHSIDELYVLRLIQDWISDKDSFDFHTSGSTGTRKTIALSRAQLLYSAKTTLSFLDPEHKFSSSLLCINPRYIGGTMVVIRALIGNMKLHIAPTTSAPRINEEIDLVSMVPLQVKSLIKDDQKGLQNINTLVIGGAAISEKELSILKEIENLRAYTSYGMTETSSHIALRNIKENNAFLLLGDIHAEIVENKLCLKGTVTNHKTVQTNDVIEFVEPRAFLFKGRLDNVINSGGYKVFPEELESILSKFINIPFFISGVTDDRLGEKVVLFAETNNDFKIEPHYEKLLHPYQRPKNVYLTGQFEYTETGKINRTKTLKKLGF